MSDLVKPAAGTSPLSPMSRAIVTACTILATVMQGVDGTIANVALPYMQGTLSASQEQISWVLTSYIVAAAIMTAPTGFLASRFGRTRLLAVSIIGFTLASVLCGMAQSLGQIVVFRVLQGMCGAALVPMSQVVLLDVYLPEERAGAMGIWTMGVMIGPILGPTLGGFLTAHYSWRSVFYVNVPFGAIAAAGVLICLPESARTKNLRLDWFGFAGLSLAIGMFQTVLDRGETLDWFSSREIVIESFLAVIGFYVFLVQFFAAPKPFLSPRLFKDRNFLIALVLIFLVGATVYSTLALLAPYVQDLMNYPVSTAGLVLAPRGFGSMVAGVLAGRVLKWISARGLVALGFGIVAYVLYGMVYWNPGVSAATIAINGFVQGVGITFMIVPISTIAFSTMSADMRTDATGVFSLLRTMGSAIGIAVTSAMLEVNMQVNHAAISSVITPFNRALGNGAAAYFWNPLHRGGAAALDGEITRQGSIIAYSDDFKLMFLAMVMATPLLLLIRQPVAAKREPSQEAVATAPALSRGGG